ncbi:hypothetical protein O3G_MSEX013143 [Manduca sexta]|uniref:OPA3-like protein CG13603 n=2 Tax=Manduca sexta TaxID=7130 RepID=A0A921ZR00_MANSE|nr:hypothetical protein O3G_MSEX013143 [Manduca sexta]
MWILNLGKPVNIPVLSQEMAIELGANLLGETVIFVIGAGLLIIEYNRQSKKESAKEAKREEEMKHITTTITDLYFTVQKQQTQLREMERLIHSKDGGKPTGPPPSRDPTGQMPPPPSSPAGQAPKKPENISHTPYYNSMLVNNTPYPNSGIILQSLNYIQMDAFSSLFPKDDVTREVIVEKEKVANNKREPAVLSTALYSIENNFRSLF